MTLHAFEQTLRGRTPTAHGKIGSYGRRDDIERRLLRHADTEEGICGDASGPQVHGMTFAPRDPVSLNIDKPLEQLYKLYFIKRRHRQPL